MLQRAILLLTTAAVLILPAKAQARFINMREAPCSAVGDGVADDRAALARAFSEAQPGDTVVVPPGEYRILLTKSALAIPAGVTVWGQAGKSKWLLVSDGGSKDHREFLRPKGQVTIEGLTIERGGDFPAVLLPIFGDASEVTLRHCRIVGNQSRFPQAYCHAIQVGVGVVKNLLLDGIAIEDCSYGLFQANTSTGTVDGVRVLNSRFERNTASDLEFNSPKGTMRNIVVRDCLFADNLCRSAGGGFAVGFANVTNGIVDRCVIQRYSSEALHVEDRSEGIRLVGNTIVGGSMGQPNGVIMVVNDSRNVVVEHNFIDGRPNSNRAHLVLVTAGGKFPNPSGVSLTGNVLVNGPSTRTWYLQSGSGPAPVENIVIPEEPRESRGGQ